MIKFDNKLELRYYFNDKSNYMDAMIKHRSEKEVLSLVRTLADMLDIKMTVYCESFLPNRRAFAKSGRWQVKTAA